ncbi:hypothetical protein A9Q78_10680 [Methylophaga sp. 41_12_T18]|nr:hypothetical protein A9Q78_10680 [Methylophaga sp. 41_12_T18]
MRLLFRTSNNTSFDEASLVIVIALFLVTMVNASELMAEQQVSEERVEQFLYSGDAFDVSFLQPTTAHKAWSVQQWTEELSQLRQLGTRSLIIQWSQYDKVIFFAEVGARDSLLHRVTTAATEVGLDFYIGLPLNSDWLRPQHLDGKIVKSALEQSEQVAAIIYQQFGQQKGFHGWYIPQELTDSFYTDDQRQLILDFFSSLTKVLHELDMLKLVLASGYTSPQNNHLVKFTMWWIRVLEDSGIDILIFQDGAGTTDQQQWQVIEPYLEAISLIGDEYTSNNIWFVAEIFTQIDGPSINNKPFRAEPANFERVSQQLDMLGHLGKKLVSFSYFPYMRPANGVEEKRLYEKYKKFVEQRAKFNRNSVVNR